MTRTTIKTSFILISTYLFILLFMYAAVSKLLDFETFQVQLAQSPMLSAYAGWVSWGVIIVELVASGLLIIHKTRLVGMYLSFVLMVMFTCYIYTILNFSEFIPCSCGGVLEKLSWTEHLIFNIGFILLALVSILLLTKATFKNELLRLNLLAFKGILVVIVMYVLSEDQMHRNNAFQRRYPHHPIDEVNRYHLKYNSYYISGITKDSIYLGNSSAPLHMVTADKQMKDTTHRRLKMANKELPFQALKTIVKDTNIYIVDGTIPVIFKGTTNQLVGDKLFYPDQQFIRANLIMDNDFVVRIFDTETTANVLGKLNIVENSCVIPYPNILKAFEDPFFDTDGLLLYNEQLQKILYVYFYRNEFVVVNKDFTTHTIGKTIDTITRAQLDVRTLKSKNEKKLGTNPIFVNLRADTYGPYLFIQSDRLGKYEPEEVIASASIIDVYNIINQTYEFSFYLYHQGLKTLNEFKVDGLYLYALIDDYLITYKMKPENFDITDD